MSIALALKPILRYFSAMICLCLMFILVGCNSEEVESFDLSISSISPAIGPNTGATTISIVGSGMTYIESVKIGGLACTGLSIVNDSLATCATPANTPGEASVVGLNSIGKVATSTFTYESVPTVDSVSPSLGTTAGGTLIEITGSGFVDGATASFGLSECTGATVVDETTMRCTTPAYNAGFALLTITNPDGKYVNSRFYAFRANPAVTSISPSGGSTAGGKVVTVIGTGFSLGVAIEFDGSSCSPVTFVSTSQVTCTTPAHALGLVSVTATNNTGLSGAGTNVFTYRAAPTVASIDIPSGFSSGGTFLTITGSDFLTGATVVVGASSCTPVNFVNATTLTCTTTTHTAGVSDVIVTNPDEQPGTLGSAFTYVAPPTITSLTPDNGPIAGGTTVDIVGTNFVGATVSIGGVACAIVTSTATDIQCTTGVNVAGLVDVVVTNTDTQTATSTEAFTYRGVPTATSVAPNAGALAGATAVTVTGTGFAAGATVDFGGSDCGTVVVVSATSLTCITSAHVAGGVSVTVTNDDGQASPALASGYTYQAAPVITSLSPSVGAPSGGTAVTFTGTDFLGGATVNFGVKPCAGVVTVLNLTTITCSATPDNLEGPAVVTITNVDGQSGSSSYNYQAVILTWSPSPHDFGTTSINVAQTFTLTNTGEEDSPAITVELSGANPEGWALVDVDCDQAVLLQFGGDCTVSATFQGASLADNSYTADLVATALPGGYSATSALSGTAQRAVLEWNVATNDYGSTNTDDTVIFTLTNNGSATSSAITTTLAPDLAGAWNLLVNNCNTTLAPTLSCTVQVTFNGAPAAHPDGPYTATLEADAPLEGGNATVDLTGTKIP